MSVTVQEIHDRCAEVLLENGGFVLGDFTEAQFLHYLGVVLLDFEQRAPLNKLIYTQMISAGTSEYIVPDLITQPDLCFIGGRLIEKVTEGDLFRANVEWRRQWDVPRQWHEDNLDPKRVELFPKPDFNGANIPGTQAPYGKYVDDNGNQSFFPTERNLTIVGPAAATQTSWVLGDTVDLPASFGPYIVYGVLAEIFSSESECRDMARAHYCRTRFSEGIMLAQVIAREELMEDE